jgi:CheY-like chemotaxis protein
MKTEKRLMRIPVMMMTAEQDPKLSSDSFAAGAVVFLPKPFTTAQLQIMLQMLIGKHAGGTGTD